MWAQNCSASIGINLLGNCSAVPHPRFMTKPRRDTWLAGQPIRRAVAVTRRAIGWARIALADQNPSPRRRDVGHRLFIVYGAGASSRVFGATKATPSTVSAAPSHAEMLLGVLGRRLRCNALERVRLDTMCEPDAGQPQASETDDLRNAASFRVRRMRNRSTGIATPPALRAASVPAAAALPRRWGRSSTTAM